LNKNNKIILNFFSSEQALDQGNAEFYKNHPQQAALVSIDVPLISNQSVLMNIALIKQYHENMPTAKAEPIVFSALRRLNLEILHLKEIRI